MNLPGVNLEKYRTWWKLELSPIISDLSQGKDRECTDLKKPFANGMKRAKPRSYRAKYSTQNDAGLQHVSSFFDIRGGSAIKNFVYNSCTESETLHFSLLTLFVPGSSYRRTCCSVHLLILGPSFLPLWHLPWNWVQGQLNQQPCRHSRRIWEGLLVRERCNGRQILVY